MHTHPPQTTISTPDHTTGGFYRHLADAIDINQARKPAYAAATDGRSTGLSNRLIWFERLSLPVARYFDVRARRFNRRGIGVVRNDFVSMDRIRPLETAPHYTRTASTSDHRRCKQRLVDYRTDVLDANRNDDFHAICRQTIDLLHFIAQLEESAQAHFAMVKHFAESVGFAACNAIEWARRSDGTTVNLSRHLIWIQVRSITTGIWFDKQAQPLHTTGCGIVVNDIPPIPFVETFHRRGTP